MHLHINLVILKDVLQLYTVVIGCVCIFSQDFMTDTNMFQRQTVMQQREHLHRTVHCCSLLPSL